jgi:hypothetical protein
MTPLKMIRTTLVSAIFRKFESSYVLCNIAGLTQYTHIAGRL